MRLTTRRREAIEKLLEGVIEQDALMDREEYKDAVMVVRSALGKEKPQKWELLEWGSRIMCGCGEKDCFTALEYGVDGDFTLYKDVTDQRHEPHITFTLPPKYEIVRNVAR